MFGHKPLIHMIHNCNHHKTTYWEGYLHAGFELIRHKFAGPTSNPPCFGVQICFHAWPGPRPCKPWIYQSIILGAQIYTPNISIIAEKDVPEFSRVSDPLNVSVLHGPSSGMQWVLAMMWGQQVSQTWGAFGMAGW